MSWRASCWAKSFKTGTPARKAVLLVIAEACDAWGWSWVGQKTIAQDAECDVRTVQRHVAALADAGAIDIYQAREQDGGIRNLYRLNFDPKPRDPVPPDHPSLRGRYKFFRGPNVKSTSGDPPDKLTGGPPDRPGDKSGGDHPTRMSHEPYRTESNRGAAAAPPDVGSNGAAAAPAYPDDRPDDWPQGKFGPLPADRVAAGVGCCSDGTQARARDFLKEQRDG